MRRRQTVFLGNAALIFLVGLIGCGTSTEIAEAFYFAQKETEGELVEELFVNHQVAQEIRAMVTQRKTMYGAYLSHKRVASNRQISVKRQGRIETVSYVFNVAHRNGRTREILILSRTAGRGPFRIAQYTIENVPEIQDPSPLGTNSA